MKIIRPLFVALLLALTPSLAAAQGAGQCCVLPDNGNGSANLPPNCQVGYTGAGMIVDGLPPGTPVLIAGRLHSFFNVVQGPGGALGGEVQTWSATLDLNLTGTGFPPGYNRFVQMPVSGETHSAPRMLAAPVQSMPTHLRRLQGQLPFGDPDFDLLRITGGYDFGMPSPGHTTLTASGPGWSVDSFFDITYRVDFVGSPVGPFAGMSGSTTNLQERYEMCHQEPTPTQPSSWGGVKAIYR